MYTILIMVNINAIYTNKGSNLLQLERVRTLEYNADQKAAKLLEMLEDVLCLVDECDEISDSPLIQEAYDLVEEMLPEDQRWALDDSVEPA